MPSWPWPEEASGLRPHRNRGYVGDSNSVQNGRQPSGIRADEDVFSLGSRCSIPRLAERRISGASQAFCRAIR
jgi:hypothetical protein